MARTRNPGLDQLGPTPSDLRKSLPPLLPITRFRFARPKTRVDLANIEKYRVRMAKLFTVERLTEEAKKIRRQQVQFLNSRKQKGVEITMPKFNLPPIDDDELIGIEQAARNSGAC